MRRRPGSLLLTFLIAASWLGCGSGSGDASGDPLPAVVLPDTRTVTVGDFVELPVSVMGATPTRLTLLNPPRGASMVPIVDAMGTASTVVRWQVWGTTARERLLFRVSDDVSSEVHALEVVVEGGANQNRIHSADVTGDGVVDLVVLATSATVDGQDDAGAVYVFAGGTTPSGEPTARLTKPSPTADDRLGSVSSFGNALQLVDVTGDGLLDVVVLGDAVDTTVPDAGIALVWAGGPGITGSPAPTATLAIPAPTEGDALGRATRQSLLVGDLTGDGVLDLLIGARDYDTSVQDAGALFLWAGGAALTGTPAPLAILTNPDPVADDQLGNVSGQGIWLAEVTGDDALDVVVGSYKRDTTVADAGEVVVWAGGSLVGAPAPHARLRRSDPVANDRLGLGSGRSSLVVADVTGDGQPDVIASGTGLDTSVSDAGAVLVWEGGAGLAGTLTETASLELATPTAGDALSRAAGTSTRSVELGDVTGDGIVDLVVLGYQVHDGALADVGKVALFAGGALSGATAPVALLGKADPTASDRLGQVNSVSQSLFLRDVTGDDVLDVVVGGMNVDTSVANAGGVYVWEGGASIVGATSPSASLERPAPTANDRLTLVLNSGGIVFGDVSGDGVDDVIVGGTYLDTSVSNAGEALVFAGGDAMDGSPAPLATLRRPDPVASDRLGVGPAGEPITVGDVTGDGILDVTVWSRHLTFTNAEEGGGLVWSGGPSLTGTPAPLAALQRTSSTTNDRLGMAGFQLGDVDDDGVLDIVASGTEVDVGGASNAGLVAFWSGASLGVATGPTAELLADSPGSNDQLTSRYLTDLTGDGILDVIALAYRYDGAASNSGALFLWEGGAPEGTVVPTTVFTDPDASEDDYLGLP